MCVSLFDSVTFSSEVQLSKLNPLMLVTLSGTRIPPNAVQPEKACRPMTVTLVGRSIDTRATQFWNAWSSTKFRESGKTTWPFTGGTRHGPTGGAVGLCVGVKVGEVGALEDGAMVGATESAGAAVGAAVGGDGDSDGTTAGPSVGADGDGDGAFVGAVGVDGCARTTTARLSTTAHRKVVADCRIVKERAHSSPGSASPEFMRGCGQSASSSKAV